jgi:hypothetical protein
VPGGKTLRARRSPLRQVARVHEYITSAGAILLDEPVSAFVVVEFNPAFQPRLVRHFAFILLSGKKTAA